MAVETRPFLSSPPRSFLVVVGGVVGTGLAVLVLVAALASNGELAGAAMLIVILILVSLPVLSRRAAKEADRRLFWILLLALLLKLAGAVANYYVSFRVYGGVADAAYYHNFGVDIAARFRAGIYDTGLGSLIGTDFIKFFTGVVYTVVGANTVSGFVMYSWLGFWGMFFFYRAFTVAVPEGLRRSYALLLFFLPSMLFWPSSIGKEAWMLFSLGIAAFGAARILSGRTWRGLLITGLGLWLAALVRPHVAGLLALALLAGYLFRRSRRDLGTFAPIAKGMGLAAIVVLAIMLVNRTDQFLEESNIKTGGGITAILQQTTERNAYGGSSFAPSILESPARAPVAIGTVLFRPLIFEAHNPQSFAAGAEGTFLLLFCLFRMNWAIAALRSIRRQPYIAFAIVYVGLFLVAFSSLANFGLLVRQRVQLLPLFLVLICVPPRGSESEHRDSGPEQRELAPVPAA